jgi:hypothetical protein
MKLLKFINQKFDLKNVTLISLAAINYKEVIYAMEKSREKISFFDCKIVSPQKPQALPHGINWEKCPPLRLRESGIDDYSHYMLYHIWEHIETDYCLVIQADGYVLNPECWTDSFFDFDYIGAPWPRKKDAYIDPFGKQQRVGNGGFSLRSRKLLEVPRKYNIEWEVNQGNFFKHMNADSLAEDGNICVHNRHIYELANCTFAPLEVAMTFSRELPIDEFDGRKTFGFHRYLP